MYILRSIVFAVLFIVIFAHLRAQDLVPNGSFEEFVRCPGTYNHGRDLFDIPGWSSPTSGTPDHFHSCSDGEASVPHNWAGNSTPFEGQGYTGIYAWQDSGATYREYLHCKLLQPLIKDSTYLLSFFYKLSSYSRYSIDRMGLLLSDSVVSVRGDGALRKTPTLSVIQDSALTQRTGLWEKASMTYRAKGGELYLTIGNFFTNAETKYYKIRFRPAPEPMVANHAYYFIDQVSVLPKYWLDPDVVVASIPEFSLDDVEADKKYVLKHILFAFDSYRLIPPSFYELDQVAEYMLNHPQLRLQLFGHTDDQGSDRYNQKLSRDRARNVAAYLKSIGVAESRMEFFGYGKSQPLINDTTEVARSQNRRVEIKFIR